MYAVIGVSYALIIVMFMVLLMVSIKEPRPLKKAPKGLTMAKVSPKIDAVKFAKLIAQEKERMAALPKDSKKEKAHSRQTKWMPFPRGYTYRYKAA